MIDTHMHVFEASLVEQDPSMRYRPAESAFLSDYQAACTPWGISGCLFVQPSFLKYDNSYFGQYLNQSPEAPFRTWGVAVLDPASSEEEVRAWKGKGVEGIRLNLVKKSLEDIKAILDKNSGLIEKVDGQNMHLEVHLESDRLMWFLDQVTPMIRKVVVDHFGLPTEGKEGLIPHIPQLYKDLKNHAELKKLWFKTSGAYRAIPSVEHSEAVKNCADLAAMLAEILPADHLLWGSDWPHTQNAHKIPGKTPAEKYGVIAETYKLWSQNGGLYDSDRSLAALFA